MAFVGYGSPVEPFARENTHAVGLKHSSDRLQFGSGIVNVSSGLRYA